MPSDPVALEALARKILLHSRRRITHIAPVLLESIYVLPERVRPTPGALSTDGCSLWFHPEEVVKNFRRDKDSVARQIVHVVAHCLLGHLELRNGFEKESAFDRAADLKAAQLVEALCGSTFASNQGSRYDSFESVMHLRPLYEAMERHSHERNRLRTMAQSAYFDDHTLWMPPLAMELPAPGEGGESSSQGDDNTAGEAGGQSATPDWNRIRQSMLDGGSGKLPGNSAGMLTENFSVPDRGMSFAEFLKRFAAPEERMLLDPDTFDARWYHLGLEYYGDIPLLEPSELSEPPQPDDIVIALDTSGSCCGETCKRFLKELLGILRDISAGASRFHVLLLQCDTEIHQEMLLETPEQVEELFETFSAQGFGGTDFRPVFHRVEQLRQSGQLPRVRGLLYLTDGWGQYPDHPTDYPTVFLIPAQERPYRLDDTRWITRLYLNDTDFTIKEATAL